MFKKAVFSILIILFLFCCKESKTQNHDNLISNTNVLIEKREEKITKNIVSSTFIYDGGFNTNDEITFTFEETEVKLFSNKQDWVEITFKNLNEKLEISAHNNCNMDAVGTSVYQFTNSEDQNLKIILIEDYQDILTGSMIAIVINKNNLVKTYRLCNAQYNYEKYNVNDILTITKKSNEFIFTFDPKKIGIKK